MIFKKLTSTFRKKSGRSGYADQAAYLSKVHCLTFSVAVKESTKKAGAAQKEAFLKEADKRAKVIFDKADANRDKKIAFEGIKK